MELRPGGVHLSSLIIQTGIKEENWGGLMKQKSLWRRQKLLKRERNVSADKLSNEGLRQDLGSWRVAEEEYGENSVSDQSPNT